MSLLTDLKNIYHLTLKPVRGADHAARMENFYAAQAGIYDDFRQRFLLGREELYASLPAPAGGVWVDLGCGTSWCLEHCTLPIGALSKVYLVDLAPSMLRMAQQRADSHGWDNVETVFADAAHFQPPSAVDVLTLSYSLTMIPDWTAAIENAFTMLKPGGLIGVADFYVAPKRPAQGFSRHSSFTRLFWPTWFRRGDVFISPDHVPYLHRRFDSLRFDERLAHVPYLPLLRIPYYIFIGQKV